MQGYHVGHQFDGLDLRERCYLDGTASNLRHLTHASKKAQRHVYHIYVCLVYYVYLSFIKKKLLIKKNTC